MPDGFKQPGAILIRIFQWDLCLNRPHSAFCMIEMCRWGETDRGQRTSISFVCSSPLTNKNSMKLLSIGYRWNPLANLHCMKRYVMHDFSRSKWIDRRCINLPILKAPFTSFSRCEPLVFARDILSPTRTRSSMSMYARGLIRTRRDNRHTRGSRINPFSLKGRSCPACSDKSPSEKNRARSTVSPRHSNDTT